MIKTFEAFNEFDPLGEEQWDEEIEFHNDEELFNFIKNRTFVKAHKYTNMGSGFFGPSENVILIDNENYEHQFGIYNDAIIYRRKYYDYNNDLIINWQSENYINKYDMFADKPGVFKRKNITKLKNYINIICRHVENV